MVVQHNMQAANANRMLNVTTSAQSKSTEKLSSGYSINRAADDAAGLTISEKMRKQIKGLDRASTNAEEDVYKRQDEGGRRWVQCEFCGKFAPASAFASYGGFGKLNKGKCYELSLIHI